MMLRYAEIGFFLLPFLLYAAWRLLGTRATSGLLWTGVVVLVLLAAATVWFGLDRGLPPGARYVPAQLRSGNIVPGHGL